MKILDRKLSLAPILLLLIISGGLVYAFTLFQVVVPSSVTITATGELSVMDLDGIVLSTVDFGSVAPGGTVSKNFQIKNLSNMMLFVYVQSDLTMFWEVTNYDGSEWVHMTPLQGGDALYVTISITAPSEAAAGTYGFNLVFSGEG